MSFIQNIYVENAVIKQHYILERITVIVILGVLSVSIFLGKIKVIDNQVKDLIAYTIKSCVENKEFVFHYNRLTNSKFSVINTSKLEFRKFVKFIIKYVWEPYINAMKEEFDKCQEV